MIISANHKIYTIGKMSGLTLKEQAEWRKDIEAEIIHKTDEKITFYHPPAFYNYFENNHKTEAEVKEWELNHIIDCDIAIVNLDGINDSVGSHFELGVINAMNMFGSKHIYVIGIGSLENIHPWIQLSLFRHEEDVESAAEYIVSYLLQ